MEVASQGRLHRLQIRKLARELVATNEQICDLLNGCGAEQNDGAPWIWNLTGELFPQAIQIVDRFHVKERLSEVAKGLYGETGEEAKRWAERRHKKLDE